MRISGVDKIETRKIRKREMRKIRVDELTKIEQQEMIKGGNLNATDIGMDLHDPDYEIDSTKHSITQNTIPIPNLAMAMRRTGMSA